MSDNDDQLIIQFSPAGQVVLLIVLTAIDGLVAMLIKTGIINNYMDMPIYTPLWWIWMFVMIVAFVILTIIIVTGSITVFRFSSTNSALIIGKSGIKMPFTDQGDIIMWESVTSYYVEQPDLQKTPCKFLYIEISNPKFSLANIFRKKKIMLIGRELSRLDDLENALYYVDKYFIN